MKILNLFAGIGGNRLPWGDEHEVTAVEHSLNVSDIYWQRFPADKVLSCDAFTYLEEHFHEYDFIWASPPCQSHSRMTRTHAGRRYNGWDMKVRLPDLRLYGVVLLLQHHFRGSWVVENVQPYYSPLVKPTATVGRHLIWSNKTIPSKDIDVPAIMYKYDAKCIDYYKRLCDALSVDYELIKPRVPERWNYANDAIGQVLRNTIHPAIAGYIWHHVTRQPQKTLLELGDAP